VSERRKLSAAGFVAAIWMLSIAGSACGGAETDPWLAALRHEPLARMVPPGGKLVLNVETEAHRALSKPITAEVFRVFSYRNADRATRGRDAVIEAATSSGWHVNPTRLDPTGPFYGSKKLSPGGATLTVGSYKADGVYKVSVALEQGACPRELCGK
jgi:hypothetical protein